VVLSAEKRTWLFVLLTRRLHGGCGGVRPALSSGSGEALGEGVPAWLQSGDPCLQASLHTRGTKTPVPLLHIEFNPAEMVGQAQTDWGEYPWLRLQLGCAYRTGGVLGGLGPLVGHHIHVQQT
jgi:hypothetical protein